MTRYKSIEGKKVPYTTEEEKQADIDQANFEKDWRGVRSFRNQLLQETDWMSLPDAPTMSDAWKKYRQDLRDITKTYKTPKDVKWPTKPE
tara:strand:+ start:192 stop:461 length:270 start_codon:yes stop_codon:yes gene_type:complete